VFEQEAVVQQRHELAFHIQRQAERPHGGAVRTGVLAQVGRRASRRTQLPARQAHGHRAAAVGQQVAVQFDGAAHAALGVAAECLRQAEYGRHHTAIQAGDAATELLHQAGDVVHGGIIFADRGGQFHMQHHHIAHHVVRRYWQLARQIGWDGHGRGMRHHRRVWRGWRFRCVCVRRCGRRNQAVERNAEHLGQMARGAVQHNLAGFGAFDGGDGDAQLALKAQVGQRLLAQAARLAQALEQGGVQQHAPVLR
jgi:hypothetical protein